MSQRPPVFHVLCQALGTPLRGSPDYCMQVARTWFGTGDRVHIHSAPERSAHAAVSATASPLTMCGVCGTPSARPVHGIVVLGSFYRIFSRGCGGNKEGVSKRSPVVPLQQKLVLTTRSASRYLAEQLLFAGQPIAALYRLRGLTKGLRNHGNWKRRGRWHPHAFSEEAVSLGWGLQLRPGASTGRPWSSSPRARYSYVYKYSAVRTLITLIASAPRQPASTLPSLSLSSH